MTDELNPETYTRTVNIEVAEIVPFKGNLPFCHGLQRDGYTRCANRAKFKMGGRPMCGVHLRPGAMFFPADSFRRTKNEPHHALPDPAKPHHGLPWPAEPDPCMPRVGV